MKVSNYPLLKYYMNLTSVSTWNCGTLHYFHAKHSLSQCVNQACQVRLGALFDCVGFPQHPSHCVRLLASLHLLSLRRCLYRQASLVDGSILNLSYVLLCSGDFSQPVLHRSRNITCSVSRVSSGSRHTTITPRFPIRFSQPRAVWESKVELRASAHARVLHQRTHRIPKVLRSRATRFALGTS
jgi:hypothetical protein